MAKVIYEKDLAIPVNNAKVLTSIKLSNSQVKYAYNNHSHNKTKPYNILIQNQLTKRQPHTVLLG